MPADAGLIALIGALHVLATALAALLFLLFIRADTTTEWSPPDGEDDDGGNDRDRPRPADGPRGGGLPLPDAVPARVRLREPGPDRCARRVRHAARPMRRGLSAFPPVTRRRSPASISRRSWPGPTPRSSRSPGARSRPRAPTRRLRRSGNVPGVVYGGGDEPIHFQVEARTLRLALADSGAVIDLSVGGDKAIPVVVKEQQRHPVDGATLHLDLLRVRLDQAIEAVVPLELDGAEEAPGAVEGGVLEHVTRELNVEALPTAIPDVIRHDVSQMEMNDTVTLASVTVPEGVTLLDDLEETVVATVTPPRLEIEPEDELEEETALVGEDGEPIEGEGEAAEGEGDSGGDEGGDEGE